MARTMSWVVTGILGAALAGCGGGGGGGGGDTANEASAQYEGDIQSSDVAGGQGTYDNVCMACHSGGPAIENLGWDPARMRQQIREGSGRMPPISVNRVSDDALEALLAYMTTNGGVDGTLPGGGGGDGAGGDAMDETSGDETIEEEAIE